MLHQEIRSGRLRDPGKARPEGTSVAAGKPLSTLPHTPQGLRSLQLRLVEMQRQLEEVIDTIDLAIKGEGLEPHI